MGVHKGTVNNPKGRPKGSINKTSREVKEKIVDFLADKISCIDNEWKLLAPKDKFKFLTDLLPYVLSKSTIEVNEDELDTEFFDKMQNQCTSDAEVKARGIDIEEDMKSWEEQGKM